MDFDDRFDYDEFVDHFNALHLLDNEDPDELIRRTTTNTRGGDAFSFKPVHMWVGSSSPAGDFYSGFDCAIEPKGVDPQKHEDAPRSERELASSFWIRFNELGDRFQFRVFCGAQTVSALRPYEGILPFRDVVPGGVELRAEKNGTRVVAHLTIRCRRPPRVTVRLVPPLAHRVPVFDRLATEADFFDEGFSDSNEVGAGKISPLGSKRAIVKHGIWLSHRFSFEITIRHYKLLWQCMIRLRLIQLEPDLQASRPPHQPQSLETSWPAEFSSSFEIHFLVEGLVSHGIIGEPELGLLSKALQRCEARDWPLILEGLFKINRKGSVGADVKAVRRHIAPPPPLPPHCMRVRRCLVTPTRCLLQPAQSETSNAMLRAFAAHQDRFLRVQFVDEDEALQITSEILEVDRATGAEKGVLARLRRAVRAGLDVAGRHYEFLCFGESQAKERGCWMIAETGALTVSAVLAWIGDLSEERVIAKHAARQGLVLSTSRALDPTDVQISVEYDLPDITADTLGHTYTFTDGVGHCTQALARRCARTLGHDAAPSAVQVRIGGGIKGVLCVVPDGMLRTEHTVKVRRSMVKFRAGDAALHVLKIATYGVAYLNRQAVVLLEAQGVPPRVLLQLFSEEKRRIEGLEQRAQEEHIAALTTFPLARAVAAGLAADPLVQNIVRVLKCRLLGDLKWKARVPVAEGTYLLGECVADETGTLNEGEVYCQIESRAACRVVTGACTVYRNPCLHPGDVRRVLAVDNPALSYLKNIVVFSTRGARDLPSMMGGGDLDGDCYTLLWDKRLVIPREHEPMDYTPPPPARVPAGTSITVADTREFWLEYLQSDVLGMLCNAHLALADLDDPGAEACLIMARLASQAVDFAKTGVPVERERCITPASYPDFMGKDQKPRTYQESKKVPARTHRSEKVLGAMFRSIDPEPVFAPAAADAWDPARAVPAPAGAAWAAYRPAAADLKRQYDFELNGVLRVYEICEAECVAGVLLRSRKRRVRVDRDYSLRIAVRDAYDEVAAAFVAQAAAYVRAHPLTHDAGADARAWAYACYQVTYDRAWCDAHCARSVAELDEGDGEDALADVVDARYCSFAWLFFEDLLALAEGAT